MTYIELFDVAVDWIESHEHTVNLLMWLVAAVIAWFLGIFRAIREWTRRPTINISRSYSHCYYEEHQTLEKYSDVALLAFVLDLEVANLTNAPIGLKSFELQISRPAMLNRWTSPVSAIGFPDMPRTPMPGNNMKVVPVWLTAFEGYGEAFCLKRVDAGDSAAGLAFFAILMPKSDIREQMKECCIKIRAILATGERLTIKGLIHVNRDMSHLERLVPKSLTYIRHPNVWTYCER